MIRFTLNILNLILYKKERFVIQVFPNYEDNGVALVNYLCDSQSKPIILINPNGKYPNCLDKNKQVRILSKKSLWAYYFILTSKYFLFTHGSSIRKFPKHQVSFNLWHGYGYKSAGNFYEDGVPADLTAASSQECKVHFSEIFSTPYDSVKITGFPRNDRLFGFDKTTILKALNIDDSKLVLFWLPTFRKSVIGDIRVDGVDAGNPFGIRDFDLSFFNQYLAENDAICIVKPHPMAPLYSQDNLYSNVIFIDDNFLHSKGITLYPLLGVTDCLISDFSSVIVDYALVDKPIICFADDLDEYRASRGIEFEKFEDMIPGSFAQNTEAFYRILKELFIEKDLLPNKRRELCKIFHQYADNNSCQRVVNTILSEKL